MVEEILKILDKAVVQDILVYNMEKITPFYDYNIVCSVSSSRQGNAAVGYLKKEAPEQGFLVRNAQNDPESKWFLVDLNSIVIHIFVGEERQRYDLDHMYKMLLG